jgi:hypothetical protein
MKSKTERKQFDPLQRFPLLLRGERNPEWLNRLKWPKHFEARDRVEQELADAIEFALQSEMRQQPEALERMLKIAGIVLAHHTTREKMERERAVELGEFGHGEPCCICGREPDRPPQIDPPMWLLENPWLMNDSPVCDECVAKGERAVVCWEGGGLHCFEGTTAELKEVCLDCGYGIARIGTGDNPTDEQMNALALLRSKARMTARKAEVLVIERGIDRVGGFPKWALQRRLMHLEQDLTWYERHLAEMVDLETDIAAEILADSDSASKN